MDPYDFAARRLPAATHSAIEGFWAAFAHQADALDRRFAAPGAGAVADPVAVMAALRPVSDRLMWEFGPSPDGHALVITAEWRDDLRPLARAVLRAAPALPRWQVAEVRPPEDPLRVPRIFEARNRRPHSVAALEPELSERGVIDIVARGSRDRRTVFDDALALAALIMGEEADRDWLGFIDIAPETVDDGPGLLDRLLRRAPAPPTLDLTAFAEEVWDLIETARQRMPDRPLHLQDPGAARHTVFRLDPAAREGLARSELETYRTMNPTMGALVAAGGRFSSRVISAHDEWFIGLRIPGSAAVPADRVADREALEDALHRALAEAGLGGVVGAGQGGGAIHLDIGLTDLERGFARIAALWQDRPLAAALRLVFLDNGVRDRDHALADLVPRR